MVEEQGTTVTGTVNYAYNSLGQLTGLNDGNGNSIVSYTYNNVGELTAEKMGDGTSAVYTYDADGNVLDLVNYAANGTTVDSSFQYTYNAMGEETSMVTLDGTWTYSYDGDGQLVHAALASTDAQIPSQSLTYVYNAAGDRVQTIVNGTTTNYTSNGDNEYTSVGGTTDHYDADGNLISTTSPSGTTTYTYNSADQLVSVTSPTDSWVYDYDAFGNLVATIHDGQTTNNLVDPTTENVVAQYTGSGGLIGELHVRAGIGQPDDDGRHELLSIRRGGLDGRVDERGQRPGQQLQLPPLRGRALDHGDGRQPVHLPRTVRRLRRRLRPRQHAQPVLLADDGPVHLRRSARPGRRPDQPAGIRGQRSR